MQHRRSTCREWANWVTMLARSSARQPEVDTVCDAEIFNERSNGKRLAGDWANLVPRQPRHNGGTLVEDAPRRAYRLAANPAIDGASESLWSFAEQHHGSQRFDTTGGIGYPRRRRWWNAEQAQGASSFAILGRPVLVVVVGLLELVPTAQLVLIVPILLLRHARPLVVAVWIIQAEVGVAQVLAAWHNPGLELLRQRYLLPGPIAEVLDDAPSLLDDPEPVRFRGKLVADAGLPGFGYAIEGRVDRPSLLQGPCVGRYAQSHSEGLWGVVGLRRSHRELGAERPGILAQLRTMVKQPTQGAEVAAQLARCLQGGSTIALCRGEESAQVRGQESEAKARPNHG
mmetsp:Transcript_72288/g.159914  ORF Transcript_72288/g.159914 Transcript_72288/m.159914 type:complete len:343 (-) Transcript_72288:47-1075(-)